MRAAQADGPGLSETAIVEQLLTRWDLQEDLASRYVLENLASDELNEMLETFYIPDRHNMWKSAAELIGLHALSIREKKGMSGGAVDSVSAFMYRWEDKLD